MIGRAFLVFKTYQKMSTQHAAVNFQTPRFDFQNMESGYEYSHNFEVRNAAGALEDITAWEEVEMVVTTQDGGVEFTLNTSDGIVIDTVNSIIRFTFSAARTEAMNGSYKHTTDATIDGTVTPFLRGCITVS